MSSATSNVQPSPSGKSLLVIEDSAAMRWALRSILEAHGYTDLTIATNADEGAACLARREFSAVLSDNNLGHDQRKGWELYEEWKDRYFGRWIIFTAHPWDIPVASGVRILDKLAEHAELISALAKITASPSEFLATVITEDAARVGAQCLRQLEADSPPRRGEVCVHAEPAARADYR
jgi:DNA-binding NtrC family response regulator